jgi:ferredoxin
MEKLTIQYFKNKCIGQGSCVAIAPQQFELNEDKADLKGSSTQGNFYTLEVDYNKRIIEAAESCPVNAIKVTNKEGKDIVDIKISENEAKEVIAQYDDEIEFVLDPEGYFLIRLNKDKGHIEVGFCDSKNKIVLKVVGKKPIEIYNHILNKERLPIRKDHAAYLGRELQKAYIALNEGIEYIQDDELKFEK